MERVWSEVEICGEKSAKEYGKECECVRERGGVCVCITNQTLCRMSTKEVLGLVVHECGCEESLNKMTLTCGLACKRIRPDADEGTLRQALKNVKKNKRELVRRGREWTDKIEELLIEVDFMPFTEATLQDDADHLFLNMQRIMICGEEIVDLMLKCGEKPTGQNVLFDGAFPTIHEEKKQEEKDE